MNDVYIYIYTMHVHHAFYAWYAMRAMSAPPDAYVYTIALRHACPVYHVRSLGHVCMYSARVLADQIGGAIRLQDTTCKTCLVVQQDK